MDIRNLTREEALKLHYEMWSDMQRDLGDNPIGYAREDYKSEWCDKHFPNYLVAFDCFLCEYGKQQRTQLYGVDYGKLRCEFCPIDWSSLVQAVDYIDTDELCKCYHPYVHGGIYSEIYKAAPISEILALPERK